MNPIIIDISEMSESKEVYDTNPRAFFVLFIYGVLVFLLVALGFAYFGEIDIVVKTNGVIRPNSQTATITNSVAGEVKEILFQDGQQVKQGDVLYVIDSQQQESDKKSYESDIEELEYELVSLELYRNSVETGKNQIGDFNKEYSTKFESYIVNLNAIEHGMVHNDNRLLSELSNTSDTLSNTRFELEMLKTYEQSILDGTDVFTDRDFVGKDKETFNTYHNQYLQFKTEQENLRLQIQYEEAMKGYSALKDAIEKRAEQFSPDAGIVYKNMYEEYRLKLDQLSQAYILAEESYNKNKSLLEAGAISQQTFEEAETVLDDAIFNYQEYQSTFMMNVEAEIEGAQNRLAQQEQAIDKLYINTLVSIGEKILQTETSIETLEQTLQQIQLEQEKVYINEAEVGDITISRVSELNQTFSQIKDVESEIKRLEANLEKVVNQIESASVKAQINGEINTLQELVTGSYLLSGTDVLSIIPVRDDMLTVNLYVNNNDIVGLNQGMKVNYNIYALPRSDYGEISGNIMQISADIKTGQEDSQQGYYLVEANVEDKVYSSTMGGEEELKVGMQLDASIITGQKRILFFLLEKLDLMLN